MHASRSSVRVTAACSVHSTTSWWLVAAGVGRNATPRSGDRCAVSTSPDRSASVSAVGEVVGEPGQHGRRLGDGRARLEQVAQDERHPESVAEHRPAAERERHGQAVLVDPVEQAPQAVARPHDPLPGPRRVPDDALEARRRVVVVADEERPAGAAVDALRAAAQIRRRVHHREHPGGDIAAAGELDQPLPCRHQLGHVLAQHPRGVREVRAGGVAVAEEPLAVRRPQLLEDAAPRLARPILLQGAKCELDRLHSYNILNENGSGGGTGAAGAAGSPVNWALTPVIQACARSVRLWSSSISRPRVTRIPRSAPG